jgi:MerR family transcriptional regulator, light-induced transcriptional regulator
MTMTLTPAGLQRYLQLRQDAVNEVAQQIFAAHGSVYAPWGPCGRDACREDLGFHLEFLRPVLEFGLVQPMVSYLVWLREVLGARGITTDHLAQSLHALGDFYAVHLDPPDATALRTQIDAVLQALALALALADAAPVQPEPPCAGDEPWPQAKAFEQALLHGQHQAAQQVVQQCMAQGHSLVTIGAQVVQPAMVRIGEGWQANRVSVAQEHMATAIAHAVMAASLEQQNLPAANGHSIMLACVKGNSHALGLRLVADAFELQGWDVVYLGANVPTCVLVERVLAERPDVLGLSVSFPQQLSCVSDVIAQLNLRLPKARPPVLVGGLAVNRFQPLVGLLGVDAHAASALDAVAAAHRLLKSSKQAAGRADAV